LKNEKCKFQIERDEAAPAICNFQFSIDLPHHYEVRFLLDRFLFAGVLFVGYFAGWRSG
jgi:hypothetical protein